MEYLRTRSTVRESFLETALKYFRVSQRRRRARALHDGAPRLEPARPTATWGGILPVNFESCSDESLEWIDERTLIDRL